MTTVHGRGLAKRTAKNSLFSAFEFIVALVLTFAITPVLVHHLGTERYGILALASTFMGFMALLDIGAAPALIRFLSYHTARTEREETETILGAGLVFYALVGSLGFLLSLVLAGPILPHLFRLGQVQLSEARIAFVISGVGFLFTMLTIPFRCVPVALQRFDLVALLNTAILTASACATLGLVVAGFGLIAVVAATASAAAATTGTYFGLAKRLSPSMRFRPVFELKIMKSILSFSSLVFLVQISSAVLLQLDRIVLGAVASVSLVSYYVVPGLLAQRLQMVTVKVTVVLFPAATDLVARGDIARVVTLYRRATGMLAVGLLSVVTPLIVGAPELLHFWLGGDFAEKSGNILRILIVTSFVTAMTTVAYYTALAFARPGVPAVFYGVGAVGNVGLMIALIPPFGLMGAAVAYLASAIPLLGLVWFAETRLLSLTGRHWLALVRRTAPMIALEAVLAAVAMHLSTNLFEAILGIGVPAAAGLLLYFAVLADEADRRTLDAFLPVRFVRGERRRATDA